MLNQKQRNLIKLGLIVAVFVMPLIAAHLCYYYNLTKVGLTNQGILLSGQDNISFLNIQPIDNINNNPNINKYNPHQWQVLYFIDNNCDNNCEQNLYKLQQVHIALGKNLHRVSRTIVLNRDLNNNNKQNSKLKNLYNKYPHMTPVYASQSISSVSSVLTLSKNNIYLADPHGNIILKYNPNNPGFDKQIFKDLKKLLSISKIG